MAVVDGHHVAFVPGRMANVKHGFSAADILVMIALGGHINPDEGVSHVDMTAADLLGILEKSERKWSPAKLDYSLAKLVRKGFLRIEKLDGERSRYTVVG